MKALIETQTQAGILTPEARAFLSKLAAGSSPGGRNCWRGGEAVQQEIDHGKFPDFLPETAEIRKGEWKVAPIPEGLARSPRGNHRAGRSQDDHQRAELGRQRFHGRFRGLEFADLEQQY